MPFRRPDTLEQFKNDFIRHEVRGLGPELQAQGFEVFNNIVERVGPLVGSLPTWHPLYLEFAAAYAGGRNMLRHDLQNTFPYHDILDHSYDFAEGILCMPYNKKAPEQAQDILSKARDENPRLSRVSVEQIEGHLHNKNCTLLLFRHQFWDPNENDIDTCKAKLRNVVRLLEDNSWTDCGETWDSMKSDLLGYPHGALSSPYVDEALGSRIKIIFEALNRAEYNGAVQTQRFCGAMHLAPKYKRRVSRWHPEETNKLEDHEEARVNKYRLEGIQHHKEQMKRDKDYDESQKKHKP